MKIVIRTLLIPLLFALFVSGCATAGGSNITQERNTFESGGKAITILANLHTTIVPSDRIETMIEERTGSQLIIQWVPDGSYEEKVNAALATETLPQAVFLKNGASLLTFRSAIRNGQFWEIGPLLSDYPNLSRLKQEVLDNTSVDGKIYGLYQERPLSRQGIIYRKDWADRLGLAAPASVEELYTMIERFTNGDPDGNGIQDTIGLTDRNDLIYGAFKTISSYFGTPNGWGEKDGRVLPEFMFPEYKDTMDFLRRLHREGLMNAAFPVTGKTDQQELFIQGKAGVYIGALGDAVSLHAKLSELEPLAELDAQNRVRGPKGYGVWSTPGYGSVVLFPKSAIDTEEKLREVLAFFDRLMEPDLANLVYWGIEGEHYELAEGKAEPITDYVKLNNEVRPYLALLVGGDRSIPEMLDVGMSLPVRAKAEKLVKDNENILIHDPTVSLDSATYNDKGERLLEFIADATYHYILGDIDAAGFDSAVGKWRQEGGDQMIEEFTQAYKRKQAAGS
ncbi:extracellular solute-binding protein [Paenibacillus harenae]|uniref:extracellular solute-binding protein n=1 Tax=Paenibacillus harenae TaxID=306543 RepID=UPI00278FBE70|nr:extracellular solute-binding protein [Paenibacillus harenae]MDQ0061440.1 putative aldouronate transport system substrate-binding protein [Paenibacillus harenae]